MKTTIEEEDMEPSARLDITPPIACITLNRPDRKNAINQQLLIDLYNAVETADKNPDVSVIILTGAGSAFCSGIDLSCIGTDNLFDPRSDGSDLPDVLMSCKKPIIGAVNGAAITGGFEIALHCDFLIAAESAFFADTHIKVGIHPGWGMTQMLQHAVGTRMAKQLSLACQRIPAQDALRMGLVNEVVPDDRLMERVHELATQISSHNKELMLAVRRLIDWRKRGTFTDAFEQERQGFKDFIHKHMNA